MFDLLLHVFLTIAKTLNLLLMKKSVIVLGMMLFVCQALTAQTLSDAEKKNKAFTGAEATKNEYHAIYQLDNNDPKIIEKAIRNINNALNDPRLKGKLHIELIAFAGGTEVNLKGGKYENDLKSLVENGVIVAQCNNSLKEKKISPDQLYDFIAVVPSGNGELILRQAEGWSVIKP
jgi:intracellular sulfur oxidation DsrE/DsrF family protein